MRKLKFRAWDLDGEEMIRPSQGRDDVILSLEDGDIILLGAPIDDYHPWAPIDAVIMQFTGLLDKNGKDLYEGDIVADHNGIGVVKYSDKYAGFRVVYNDRTAKWFYDYNLRGERESIEIIGNFYESPQLLEKVI